MWSNVILESDTGGPCSRSKHCGVFMEECNSQPHPNVDLYVYGGRSGTFPLKDFWKMDLKVGVWEQVKGDGDSPSYLQQHSMVADGNRIYVFGGEISFSDQVPLWIYDVRTCVWKREEVCSTPGGGKKVMSPPGRRGHTALVWDRFMLIYGGYRDLKGSLGDLWALHLDTSSWHLFSSSDSKPLPRHSHVSVLYNNNMYIHGGLNDLCELSDLWRYDLLSRRWLQIKLTYSPLPLHGHVGIVSGDSLLIMSGERDGKAVDEFWRFSFIEECFEKICFTCRPCPRVFAWGGVIPDVHYQESINYSLRRSGGGSGGRFECEEDDLDEANFNKNDQSRRSFRKSNSFNIKRFFDDYQTLSENESVFEEPIHPQQQLQQKVRFDTSEYSSMEFEMGTLSKDESSPTPKVIPQPSAKYMLLIGGSECHSSQVVNKKQPLTIWRLRLMNSSANNSTTPSNTFTTGF